MGPLTKWFITFYDLDQAPSELRDQFHQLVLLQDLNLGEVIRDGKVQLFHVWNPDSGSTDQLALLAGVTSEESSSPLAQAALWLISTRKSTTTSFYLRA